MTTEEELVKLVNSDKCRSVRIDGKNYWISKKVKNEVRSRMDPNSPKYEGGFAFLAAIPAIIAGLAGAAGVASGVASTVASSKDAILKQKQINKLDSGSGLYLKNDEQMGKGIYLKPNDNSVGSGIYLKSYEGTAIHKYFKNIFDDDKLKKTSKKFKNGIEIEVQGDGLFLKPYNYTRQNGHSDED